MEALESDVEECDRDDLVSLDNLVSMATEEGGVMLKARHLVPVIDCSPDDGKDSDPCSTLNDWDGLDFEVISIHPAGSPDPQNLQAVPAPPQAICEELNRSACDVDQDSFENLPSPEQSTAEEIVEDATVSNIQGSSKRSRTRDPFKRKPPTDSWSKQEAKMNRQKGVAYMGRRRKEKKSANITLHDAPKPPRTMGPRCKPDGNCQKWTTRDCDKVSEDQRRILFDTFWKTMCWKQRQMFVVTLVDLKTPKQQKHEVKRVSRSVTYTYHLRVNDERIPVCQKLFLNTFGLKFSTVGRWLMKYRSIGSAEQESSSVPVQSSSGTTSSSMAAERANPSTEGAVMTKATPRSRASVQIRTEYLRNFIDVFPKLPSHYCRSTTKKQYLQTDIRSMAKFYELYKSKCEEDNVTPLSRFVFDQHAKSKNVSIFTPRKDQCDECFKFRMNSVSKERHDFHIKMKNRAREEKENDKLLAKEKKIHLLCVDVMAVQMLPKIEASIAYYKMKLAVHNYTMYNLENNDVLNCWFTECDTSLEASTFASCLVAELERLLTNEIREVVVFSDGCSYQNKNNVLANALLAVSMKHQVIIHQKYFEKGHSQMEADSVHSLVERTAENLELFLPHEYDAVSRMARKGMGTAPYRSKLMNIEDFKDFSNPDFMRYDSIRPGNKPHEPTVNDLKWLKYNPAGTIEYKIDFDADFQLLPRRPKTHVVGPFNYPQMNDEPVKITKDKYEDLLSLKSHIPEHCHYFYENLPHQEDSKRKAKTLEKNKRKKSKLGAKL